MTKFNLLLILCLFGFSISGCSSLYYFPVQNQYLFEPSQVSPSPEVIHFNSADGTQLEAWYFKTIEKNPKGLILHFHGNAQNLSTHFGFLWKSVAQGYDYMIFDYRGYGNSQGKPDPAGLVLDGRAALKWAEDQRQKRGNIPLIVFCQSLGGAVCTKALSEEKDIIPKVLVIDSSFSNYRSVARSVFSSSWLLWIFQPIAWIFADNSQSPQNDIKNLKAGRFLVVHGEKDQVVDIQHGKNLFDKLSDPKELWIIPNGQHIDFLVRNNGEYRNRFYNWLKSAL